MREKQEMVINRVEKGRTDEIKVGKKGGKGRTDEIKMGKRKETGGKRR